MDLVETHAVIEMTVREQDGAHMEMAALNIVENEIGVRAGVDDGGVERCLVRDNVAIGLQVSDFDGFDEHESASFYSSLVSSRMVIGPLLTDSTSMSAPNSPVSTWNPASRQSAITRS